ncbi:multidrug efflux SMR transporter [Fictibacillus enclensis]|uniref:Multidrug resistance protein SMR n=1 Tax=Fictibacillus enclensis TaxID=1017270 RepID=A0A0V8J223_9BACL|nr:MULTISPECIES: multidrug efflux SMR transporter [Fictibacillus]KSU81154.1 multidrug resistance protein SMR [Fictibacillus enclensis]MDM5197234.1 multidrug efflux SMR transporter [Fictibacillus enclensis]MDM5336345.1 multidrug efflux SMR transporter [Fictibacillus enclensis]RXZ00672.1 QacE family quaternary ammonium compound efflux SMR transporter [Fictibacillus sp. S7]WHY72843.1 multidrug efflux SMR transporter [Fictibacillus enclensis]
MNRYWFLVIMGGLLEVLWVSGLKHADTPLEWTATGLVIVVSFFLLIPCLNKLPVGTVYAVFTGLGTAGTVLAEMLFFGVPFSWAKVSLIALLLVGVMGLKAVTGEPEAKGSEV